MILLAYIAIGLICAIIAAAHMKIETGTKDDDLTDYMTYTAVGLFTGIGWPVVVPIGLIAVAWERISDRRERKTR
ncbi:hypothetical protein [Brevibacterium sp. CT2-23B]|uniref:hypothetical protein n=1 Tax=Brevibacterium sp. CT2-23B TaxID=2729630 RepID=UPI00155570E1|nr:hypothetical protein [Brevibacterium sp. CT2-23B]